MSTQINEFTLNIPLTAPTDVPSPAPTYAVPAEYSDATASVMGANGETDQTTTIGSPDTSPELKNISVYAQSINPVSFDQNAEVAAFDIVFSVGVYCGETSKTYQVVKRIGIDKKKIASEVESTSPMSIVENKTEEKPAVKEGLSETARRARRLAGLE